MDSSIFAGAREIEKYDNDAVSRAKGTISAGLPIISLAPKTGRIEIVAAIII